MAHPSPVTRLDRVESAIVRQRISEAIAKARMAGAAQFARVLRAALPGTPTHAWVDLALLRDDELALLAEEQAYDHGLL